MLFMNSLLFIHFRNFIGFRYSSSFSISRYLQNLITSFNNFSMDLDSWHPTTLLNMLSSQTLKKNGSQDKPYYIPAIGPSTWTLSHWFALNNVVIQLVRNLSLLRLVTNLSVHLTQVRSDHILSTCFHKATVVPSKQHFFQGFVNHNCMLCCFNNTFRLLFGTDNKLFVLINCLLYCLKIRTFFTSLVVFISVMNGNR